MMADYSPTQSDVQAAKALRDSGGGSGTTDPMLKRSPDSAAMLDYWDLTDTIVDGIDAVRAAGDKYLPRFTEEQNPDYTYRLRCTKMTNIYRDTVEGLASKPFEQEITLLEDDSKKPPTEIVDFIEDVDGSGNNLTMFSSAVFFNGINSAIDWIFIDYSKPDKTIRNRADQKKAGLRPYWSHVLGRNVLDPQSTVINGKEVLTYIKVFEPGTPDHIRIFIRDDNGVVRWALFEKTNVEHDLPLDWLLDKTLTGKTMFTLIDEGLITIGVIPLVAFHTGRRDGRRWRFYPAMRDAADLQIELYQQESALKFVKILAGYPMLAGNGVAPQKSADGTIKALGVGPGRVLYAPPAPGTGASGSWTYVEPGAQSMKFLADDVKETQQQLRELARQPLTAQSGNVTVINSAAAASKGKSAVKAWALGLKDAIENAMVITCMWIAIKTDTYDPVVNVFTEFDEFLEGKDLDALQKARDGKDISRETYWEELKRRAVLSPEFKAETEEKRLLDELPGDGEDTLPGAPVPKIDPITGLPA